MQDPPRAPFPELLAAGSFAIGGVDLAVPYLASFFIPWVALLWVSRFASRATAPERLLIGLYVCTIPAPVRAGGLQWMVDREGLAIQVIDDYREPDLPALMRRFADSDLVFAEEEGGVLPIPVGTQRMPAARMQGEILRALRERGDLRIIATLREPGGKELYLFQRVRTGAGLAEDS